MNNKGFTLVELIIVIVLLLIIAGLIIPKILKYIDTSHEESFKLLEKNLISVAETIYLDNEDTMTERNEVMISLEGIVKEGYLELEDFNNPITGDNMSKCLFDIYRDSDHNDNKDNYYYVIKSTTPQYEKGNTYCPCYSESDDAKCNTK